MLTYIFFSTRSSLFDIIVVNVYAKARALEANCANVQRQESLCHREDNARTSSKRGVFASSRPFGDEDFSRWYKLSHFYFASS